MQVWTWHYVFSCVEFSPFVSFSQCALPCLLYFVSHHLIPGRDEGGAGGKAEIAGLFLPVWARLQCLVWSCWVPHQRWLHNTHHVRKYSLLWHQKKSHTVGARSWLVVMDLLFFQMFLSSGRLSHRRFPLPTTDCWSQRNGAIPKLRFLVGSWQYDGGKTTAFDA